MFLPSMNCASGIRRCRWDRLTTSNQGYVCWLELEALATLVGEDVAFAEIRRRPVYPTVYASVTRDRPSLTKLFDGLGMGLPEPGRQ
jgi:hypothetical protein